MMTHEAGGSPQDQQEWRPAKILVAISSDLYVRNYLRTDALEKLLAQNNCDIVADNDLALRDEVTNHPQFLTHYSVNRNLEKRHNFLFNLMMWRHRKKSRTFFYRWVRNSQWHRVDKSNGASFFVRSFAIWLVAALRNPNGLRVPVLGNRIVFPIISPLLKMRLPVNKSLRRIVSEGNYDGIVFPSAAFDSVTVDLARLGKSFGVPTLCLIDNWDNLTSKTVFWVKPNFLGVWGQQAKDQAQFIHGFEPENVHLIGTPRFDTYFLARRKSPPESHYPFPYILFVGSAMPFDELRALGELEKAMTESAAIPNSLKIVYRPHPWQQKRISKSNFQASDFSRTVLDIQLASAYAEGIKPETTNPGFQPDLHYYPSLLQNSRLVTGPLTTMLFEAALCLRPVVALAYDDGIHHTTSLKYFSHFDGAAKIPGFFFCESESALGASLEKAVSNDSIPEDISTIATEYFLFHSKRGYAERLASLANEIFSRR